MALTDCSKCWSTPCTCGYAGYLVISPSSRHDTALRALATDAAGNAVLAAIGLAMRVHLDELLAAHAGVKNEPPPDHQCCVERCGALMSDSNRGTFENAVADGWLQSGTGEWFCGVHARERSPVHVRLDALTAAVVELFVSDHAEHTAGGPMHLDPRLSAIKRHRAAERALRDLVAERLRVAGVPLADPACVCNSGAPCPVHPPDADAATCGAEAEGDVSCSWCMGRGPACQICGFKGDGTVTVRAGG